jgi:hypothetical protein
MKNIKFIVKVDRGSTHALESWKDLYQAAIFEPDLNKLAERIDEAEAALVISARELFYTAGDSAEVGESLDDAMCILHALRNSLKHRPIAIQTMNDLDYLKNA